MRTLCIVALLAVPAIAQDPDKAVPASATSAAQAENVLFKAYYHYRALRRYDAALELYRDFLKAAPDHRYARRAAEDVIAILNRTDRRDEADKARKAYAEILGRAKPRSADRAKADRAKADGAKKDGPANSTPAREVEPPRRGTDQPTRERGDRPRRGERSAGDAPAGRPLTDAQKTELKASIDKLRADLSAAREAKDERTVARLERQIARADEQLKTGVRPERRGRSSAGGSARNNRRSMNFAEMSKDQIAASLERIERFTSRSLDRMREQGQGKQADEFEQQWKDMKTLLDDDKKAEAQKVFEELMGSMMRRRR